MDIAIDLESPTPLFAQLVEQIKGAVSDAHIKPGDPLPSIRQLATDLELNNKTVAKAYRLLERDAVIQTRGYRGTFVHPEAVKNCQFDLAGWVETSMQDTITRLRQGGATDSEIRIAFNAAMNALNP